MVWVLLLSMAMPQGGGVAIEKLPTIQPKTNA